MKCELCMKEVNVLVDGIYDSKPIQVCENCARFRDVIIVSKPTKEQLEQSNRVIGVRERLAELTGIKSRPSVQEIEFPDSYGFRVRKARRKFNFTQDKLAEQLGVKTEDIVKIESGELPEEKLANKIRQFLRVELRPEERRRIEVRDIKTLDKV